MKGLESEILERQAIEHLNRESIFAEIINERENQDLKWGEQNHHPMIWLGILGEEFGEVCQAATDAFMQGRTKPVEYDEYRSELIQVAAVAVSMIECLDRNKYQEDPK